LGLAKAPAKIEGYDTSNIFGHEAVASMVTFTDGEADKSGYRKFKIRLEKSTKGDTDMLKEILNRRLAHAFVTEENIKDYWPLPDLMIIDGGKAQLNLALAVLKKYDVNLPVISISKGGGLRSSVARDKIFMSGLDGPIELSLNSPALHLVKRVRDESHRFAITYHRDLRSKNFIHKKDRP
jgi:excinuclease ABC subunit C